jgi:hypothetical protein
MHEVMLKRPRRPTTKSTATNNRPQHSYRTSLGVDCFPKLLGILKNCVGAVTGAWRGVALCVSPEQTCCDLASSAWTLSGRGRRGNCRQVRRLDIQMIKNRSGSFARRSDTRSRSRLFIGSRIDRSSFSGLLTRVQIGHIRIGSAENTGIVAHSQRCW